MNMHWITILGIVLIAAGTLCTFIGQQIIADKGNKELIAKSEKVEKLSEDNMRLNKELLDKSGKVEKLSKDNMQLNREIAQFNKETAGYIAGDSYCVAVFDKFNEGLDNVVITVTNEGNNPLYELSMTINELDENLHAPGGGKLFKNSEETFKALQNDFTVSLGIIPPKRGTMFPAEWPFFKKKSRNYNITFTSRGGEFTQLYRAAFIKGQWRTAIKVYKQNIDKPLYEKIDPDYPRGENGQIKWN